MSIQSRVSRWLAASALCALFTLPAEAEEAMLIALKPAGVDVAVTSELIAQLDRWLDTRIEWPKRDAPKIRYVTARRAAQMKGDPGRGHGRTRGLYDAESETIYLVTPWSAEDTGDVSVLLHELVHHRQAPHHFYCGAAREPAAYRAQEEWLAERGDEIAINWLAVIWDAGCTRRDIHPD
ncbi:DUF6647 family protein [Pseudooceanicola sp.]|uniref:DUF6647 family protein n=1 Tax=Pseudooceanicola sp. TaxID=1914328 RepID=UPI0035C704E8